MALYRSHKGFLNESMQTIVEVNSITELGNHILSQCGSFGDKAVLEINHYGFDHRIGWNNHTVSVNGCVVGFLNEFIAK